jgi:hypothetical protein
MKPFWMIARAPTHPGSKTEPKTRFDSEEAAIRSARGLARETGAAFVVLAVTRTIHPGDRDQPALL